MEPENAVSRSTLDIPLHQLNEDDISQLTREDCRRYLKEKGMRRPSWNKAQAIQQVISLKTLLETTSDFDSNEPPRHHRLHIPCSHHRNPANSFVPAKEANGDLSNESDPNRRNELRKNDSASLRTTVEANEPVSQMTIFYCGKVNVFNDVPKDKAQAILQLAACPLSLPLETSSDSIPISWPIPCQLEAPGVKTAPSHPILSFPTLQSGNKSENCHLPRDESNLSHEDILESPRSRKASVQRYLEKRKDRFKNKRKVAMASSASSDIYLNDLFRDQFSNNQQNLTDACSPTRPRPPQNLPDAALLIIQ